MSLPQIVDEQQWRESNAALIEKEKAATRAGDALAAERRRQPMMAFDTGFEFDGPSGRVSFLDLFEGRPQLVLYHFWFPEDGEPCGGCSMFTDQIDPPRPPARARRELRAGLPRFAGADRRVQGADGLGDPVVHGRPRVPGVLRHDGVLPVPGLPARRRRRLPHLRDHGARERGDRDRVVIPRPHAVRAPGGVGGHPGRTAAGAALPVVAQARRATRASRPGTACGRAASARS